MMGYRREIEVGRHMMKKADELAEKMESKANLLRTSLFELIRRDFVAFETLEEIVQELDKT